VIGGSVMGMGCWAICLLTARGMEDWVNTGSLAGESICTNRADPIVPLIVIPLTLALVHYHPEPVDNCPCFEDAIAVLSVILGSTLGHWWTVSNGYTVAPRDILLTNPYISIPTIVGRITLGKYFNPSPSSPSPNSL
jgi:hypothetical protein